MTDPVQQSTDISVSSENTTTVPNDENQSSEKRKENESTPSEQSSTRRVTMPQDIRYATDQNDRDRLIKKYNNYQVSDVNACNIRFLTDNRQRKNLFGRNEEEHSNLHSFAKAFNVNVFPGYQQPTKHSYKIFGTESNVRTCLIESMNRMFKRSNRSTQRDHNEHDNQQLTSNIEQTQETEVLSNKEVIDTSSPSESTLVATVNLDSSITEEQKSVTSNTEQSQAIEVSTESKKHDEKSSQDSTSINPDSSINHEKPNDTEHEQLAFKPLERKHQFTFIMLISNQGQEVLKKNWNFFAGSLQQRLNVVVLNPVKLPKFGDKQVHNELSITGELTEDLTDACLQIAAFINDVLGVPTQLYKADGESASKDNDYYQRPKNDNQAYRSSPPNYQGRSPYNNYHGRTFVNRNRNDILEQVILIRSDCVSRIIGTRGSNLKRIQTKCHLRDMIVGRQANENGYIECILSAYQTRNLHFAIDTVRSFLRNEDDSAVLVPDSNQGDNTVQDSPHLHELAPPHIDSSTTTSQLSRSNKETGFTTKSLNLGNNNSYPQPSYNFQNPPSFDFTHQATTASRKTDKRRGELHDHNKTPSESQNQPYDSFSSSHYSSNSPRHKSKRSCPETKEINCTTDEGFWIQKQYYHALDDASKQLFDSLIDKLDKIRIANEENAARKQQRLVGRNRSNKTRVHTSSISYLNDDSNHKEKDLIVKPLQIENTIKFDQSTDVNEEKENKQETSTVIINQD
ncbi:unnamed protein product [Rotaria socialis]|uniref:K Homology domain-containing protein n=1 Tax=Rotaria socialis TaxID=392032 RepID=A0A820SH84_9BILA|nr:unnamed protein product [Rotaria socialis]CAF4449855.1 unnamed protein product [Rotaria socialis]